MNPNNKGKKEFVLQAQSRVSSLPEISDRIRFDYLLSKASTYELVSEATRKDSQRAQFAREIIGFMHSAIKESPPKPICTHAGIMPYISAGNCPFCD